MASWTTISWSGSSDIILARSAPRYGEKNYLRCTSKNCTWIRLYNDDGTVDGTYYFNYTSSAKTIYIPTDSLVGTNGTLSCNVEYKIYENSTTVTATISAAYGPSLNTDELCVPDYLRVWTTWNARLSTGDSVAGGVLNYLYVPTIYSQTPAWINRSGVTANLLGNLLQINSHTGFTEGILVYKYPACSIPVYSDKLYSSGSYYMISGYYQGGNKLSDIVVDVVYYDCESELHELEVTPDGAQSYRGDRRRYIYIVINNQPLNNRRYYNGILSLCRFFRLTRCDIPTVTTGTINYYPVSIDCNITNEGNSDIVIKCVNE